MSLECCAPLVCHTDLQLCLSAKGGQNDSKNQALRVKRGNFVGIIVSSVIALGVLIIGYFCRSTDGPRARTPSIDLRNIGARVRSQFTRSRQMFRAPVVNLGVVNLGNHVREIRERPGQFFRIPVVNIGVVKFGRRVSAMWVRFSQMVRLRAEYIARYIGRIWLNDEDDGSRSKDQDTKMDSGQSHDSSKSYADYRSDPGVPGELFGD